MNRFIGIALSVAMFSTGVNADKITLLGDPWCPFNCTPNSNAPGYYVEVAKEIFAKSGHELNYEVMEWAKAIETARAGKTADGLVSCAKADTPDFVFPNQGMSLTTQYFWTKKDSPWVYKDLSSLNGVILVSMAGYHYGSPVDEYIEKNKGDPNKVQVKNSREEAFAILDKNPNSTYIEEHSVMLYDLKEKGIQNNYKGQDSKIAPIPMYISFSPNNPKAKEYAAILSVGLEKMKGSPELKRLQEKYGITE